MPTNNSADDMEAYQNGIENNLKGSSLELTHTGDDHHICDF